ncbi:MAG: QueT transporter family protein [Vallitaleaceae bacterium]|nr:QueT transporter family protein [Vallitaleaceae bacterium]
MDKRVKFIVQAANIAAIYAVLTIAFAPISSGQIQVRISEALTILPFFTPAAIPGLFVGCLIANVVAGIGPIDIIFGSLATLLAAALTYLVRKYKFLVPFPPVVVNGIIVGLILNKVYGLPLLPSILWVALGEVIACYGLGLPLLLSLKKYGHKIFK